ncbi:MAG TPA: ROK family protein [Gaiellaceae bacterium]|nr:ROK family protein [Gaiellaceae bacterium]
MEPTVIGVDVGGTKILAGLVARDGTVAHHRELLTPLESEAALLDGLESAVRELLDDSVASVGFGIPSRIDQRAGVALGSVNIPLKGVAFRDEMSRRLGLPVGIDNDANAAAIAEWTAGAGRGTKDMIMLTLGTGVGGGLILGGKPYRGSVGAGGELGHVVIVHDGLPCSCGGLGHLESYVSGTAADEVAREVFGPAADAHRLVRLGNEGDPQALELLTEIGRKLGSGLGSLINTFDPELIVIGGGFAAAGELILGPAREVMEREALEPIRESFRIVRAELGTAAGMIGAAMVAFEALDAASV